jgi:ABC-type phosphonate transport system ATPase subunit
MSFLKKIFGAKPTDPFMEHPTGGFDSAVAAMEDAVRRLRELPSWE